MSAPAKKILIVEDSDTQALALRIQLSNEGWETARANSAEQALDYLRGEIPDLAIIDHHLPGMAGVDLCRLLRQNPATEAMPVLMLTNDPKADLERRGLECGADDHLTKTADPDLLIVRVQTLLRKSAVVSQPNSGRGAAFRAPRILVVGDDAKSSIDFKQALAQLGCELVMLASAEEGIAYVGSRSIDCVIIDLHDPGSDDIKVCEQLSRLRTASRLSFAIVFISKQDATQETILAVEAGADDIVSKTADPTIIAARINSLLRRKALHDENERIQAQFRNTELEILKERAERHAVEARAQMAEELQKANGELERAYRELKETQVQLIQSAKMISLGELVAGIAHEVNNPLAFSMAHLGTVASSLDKLAADSAGALTDQGTAYLSKARQRALDARSGLERVTDIVTRLRTFSRLDEGEFKDADIAECIGSAVAFISLKLKSKSVGLDTSFADDNRLYCAPGLLNQAFLNLISNAADAAGDQGHIRIRSGRDESFYWVTVGDSGPGIPQDIRERIFEPFFTTKDVGEGTGLGLPITYRIVDRHGGTIEVQKSDLGGAEFLIRLPVNLAEKQNVA